MSEIKSNSDDLVLNSDGGTSTIKFQTNGVERGSISTTGAFTATTIDATALTGTLPAISGASLTSLTSANLTGALPALDGSSLTGIAHPDSEAVITAIADGALTSGQSTIMQADGTVKGVVGSTVLDGFPLGTPSQIESSTDLDIIGVALDPNNDGKGVVAWRDGTSYKCKVFTTSGSTITYGSTQTMCTVSNGFRGDNQMIDYCSSDKFVIGYIKNGDSQNSSTNGCVRVCTISGTTVTAGGESVVDSVYTNGFKIQANNTGDVLAMYVRGGGGYRLMVRAGGVSGSSISWGSEHQVTGDNTDAWWMDRQGSRVVISLKDHQNSFNGRVCAFTISGNSISAGSMLTYDSNTHAASGGSVRINPNNLDEFLLSYHDINNSNYGVVRLGSISGNSISLGSTVTFISQTNDSSKIGWDKNNTDKFLIQYHNSSDTYATGKVKYKVGTVSGSSITFGTEKSIPNSNTSPSNDSPLFNQHSLGAAKFFHIYNDSSSIDTGVWSQVGGASSSNLSDKFIGFSKQAYADTTTATILVNGAVTSNQSSLTPADKYYVQGDGTLDLTASTPSVYAGIAISATDLLIKG